MTERQPPRTPKKPPKARRPGLLGATRTTFDAAATAAELTADEARLRVKKQQAARLRAATARFLATVRRYVDEGKVTEDVYQSIADAYASTTAKLADDDVHALVRGLKALAKGSIVVVPTKTPRKARREIIRKAGDKDRAVLDRLRDHDKNR